MEKLQKRTVYYLDEVAEHDIKVAVRSEGMYANASPTNIASHTHLRCLSL